jgi:hypothetical protein
VEEAEPESAQAMSPTMGEMAVKALVIKKMTHMQ